MFHQFDHVYNALKNSNETNLTKNITMVNKWKLKVIDLFSNKIYKFRKHYINKWTYLL